MPGNNDEQLVEFENEIVGKRRKSESFRRVDNEEEKKEREKIGHLGNIVKLPQQKKVTCETLKKLSSDSLVELPKLNLHVKTSVPDLTTCSKVVVAEKRGGVHSNRKKKGKPELLPEQRKISGYFSKGKVHLIVKQFE